MWQGVQVHVPGEGDRRLLGIGLLPIPKPTGGATYRYSTVARDVFDCVPLAGGGDGFRMTTTMGLRYYFTVTAIRSAAAIRKRTFVTDPVDSDQQMIFLARSRYYMLATKIEDRFGNAIEYTYNSSGHPTRIWSNDGSEILLTYTNGRLNSASSNGLTWQYHYVQAGDEYNLSSVVLPDASKWQYAYTGNLKPYWSGVAEVEQSAFCDTDPLMINAGYEVTATHPAGAEGQFSFINRRHWRSGVAYTECEMEGFPPYDVVFNLRTPHFFDVMSLKHKTISGPGIDAPMTWSYDFGSGFQDLFGVHGQPITYPCTNCDTEKTVALTHPDGSQTLHRFGIQYWKNEGRLLATERRDAGGTVLRAETIDYVTDAQAPSQNFYTEYGGGLGDGSDPSTRWVRPEVRRTTIQQGRTHKWEVDAAACAPKLCFDILARPTRVVKSSSP